METTYRLSYTLADIQSTMERAGSIDVGRFITMGCGRQTKYAPEYKWITDKRPIDDPNHVSVMWTLDGFGRWERVTRQKYDQKTKSYTVITREDGKLTNKRGLKAFASAIAEKCKNMHVFHIGAVSCYSATPWW